MGFWNALSVLAPVAPALSDAADLRTQRQEQEQAFQQQIAQSHAALAQSEAATAAERQKTAQGAIPVTIGEPQWNPATHSNQILTFDKNTGGFAMKNVPGVDPMAAASAKYQSARQSFKQVTGKDLTPEQDQSLFYQSYGLKPPVELTPFQQLQFNQPKLTMSGGVPVVSYQGRDYTSADLKSKDLPEPVRGLLQSGSDVIAQKDAIIDQRQKNEDRRMDMADKRFELAMKNSPNGPIPGNPNVTGEAYLNSLPQTEAALVKAIGTGHAAVERLSYILTRNPKLLAEVSQAFPDFDSSKIQSYIAAFHNFTSGKASEQMKAGANAVQHLYRLKAINDANPVGVHNASTASYKQYQGLLNVVVGELAKFYGMPQTNQTRSELRAPLAGFLNRGSAIQEQANAMGVAFNDLNNQWNNAKPSSSYQAPLPGLNAGALAALKALAPEQYQTFVGSSAGTNAQPGVPQGWQQ